MLPISTGVKGVKRYIGSFRCNSLLLLPELIQPQRCQERISLDAFAGLIHGGSSGLGLAPMSLGSMLHEIHICEPFIDQAVT